MESISYEVAVEMFEDALNCEGMVEVAGMQFSRSTILKECDPIAYNCYLNDYIDSLMDDFEVTD